MIYCPKCGASTEQFDEEGNTPLSCSSCGVVKLEFLEQMANDAVWPSIVDSTKHEIICPKCGYERYDSDKALPRTACPNCHTSYKESLLGKSQATKACNYCGEQVLVVARKCKHCGSTLDLDPPPSIIAASPLPTAHQSGAVASNPAQDALRDKVCRLVGAGKKIDAIKLYRAETGAGLKEAVDYLDSLGTAAQAKLQSPLGDDHDTAIACPKCGSHELNDSKKGLNILGAAAAVTLLPVLPWLGGAVVGLRGRNKIRVTCLKCGHAWIAGA